MFRPVFHGKSPLTPLNGLLNNLVAFWPGNEASGNALDLHTNALHLADINTVTNNTGLVYATARQFTRANNEFFNVASSAFFQTGDVDFTFACWCYFDSTAVDAGLIGKDGTANMREYQLGLDAAVNRIAFSVSPTGLNGSFVTLYANSFGAIMTSVWYLIIAWHDSVSNTINVDVNTVGDSSAYATGVAALTSPFRIGSCPSVPAAGVMGGRIGPAAFWKSAGGLGGVLTATQRALLYNAGAGLPYTSFTN